MAVRLFGRLLILVLAVLFAGAPSSLHAVDDRNRGEPPGGGTDDRAVLDTEMLTVRTLEKLHAKIRRDEKRPGRPVIGVELSVEVGKRVDLPCLAALSQLEELKLMGTGITDAGLQELAKLKHLRVLILVERHVTGAGLNALQKTRPGLNISDERERNTGVVIPPVVIP